MGKYILHPGYIRSQNDGDEHFISFADLVWLYNLHPGRCIEYTYHHRPGHGDVHLYPQYDGDYKLPDSGKDGGR